MDNFLSAVLGELTTRSISFFIRKCSKLQEHDVEDHLHRALVRAQVILDEAMGRQITNQAMLRQLDILRGTMHQGYYMLDTFRYQSHDEEDAKDQIVSRSLYLSKVNPLKYFCSSNRNTQILEQLQKVLDNLSSMILDMEEVVIFFTSYSRLYRQPYSMHVLLGNCMFGRHMEAELAIKFLLHTQPQGYEELEVLPIVGPNKVGKSTLVAHVCKDERVYGHFSEIVLLHDHDFTDAELAFREGCAMKHQNHMSSSNNDKRLLVVVELAGDLNDDAWDRLYYAYKSCLPRGSKIIVTSRSEKVVRFGTAQALTLKHLPAEAYWYFFKTITFGSVDPETQPRFLQLAMEISRMQNGSLNGANIISSLLRDNFDIHFWCKIATFLRGFIQKSLSKFGETPFDLLYQNKPVEFGRMATSSEKFLVSYQYECSSQEEIPKIRIQDVMFGSVKPHGKIDILLWRAQIPPYYSYVYTCSAIQEPKATGAKRKRSMKNGVTPR
ncbi:hypothetical protein PAHAL_2G009700 [Panicum hallii]|jgi:hypothetical protein|uniref:NB-ARC domain-containing protein n=1 Tax=Panicum hallii TaxID=206008 RepID=A0A2S3GV48_9POAL|nr:putative disease resistance protein RGA3 isoform X1 [Panicum hallii]XP_025799351.1 putative disease resistance protein RGA3 isoform X1 [Panicum hallii]PAN09249.1 hypothetical protein PAHAL_2G009700 [Panicum hallii]